MAALSGSHNTLADLVYLRGSAQKRGIPAGGLCLGIPLNIENAVKQFLDLRGRLHTQFICQNLLQIVIQLDRHIIVTIHRIDVHDLIVQLFIIRIMLEQNVAVLLDQIHILCGIRIVQLFPGTFDKCLIILLLHGGDPLFIFIAVLYHKMREKSFFFIFQDILFIDMVPVNIRHALRIQRDACMAGCHQNFFSKQLLDLVNRFPQVLSAHIFIVRTPEHVYDLFPCSCLLHTEIIEKSLCLFIWKIYTFSVYLYIRSSQKMYTDVCHNSSLIFSIYSPKVTKYVTIQQVCAFTAVPLKKRAPNCEGTEQSPKKYIVFSIL